MIINNQENKFTFIKMSALGNDFIIFDYRQQYFSLNSKQILEFSNRKNIGCDQLIVIRNALDADCLMEIYNSDGSLSGACGNATRCVAAILMADSTSDTIKIKTAAGILKCWREAHGLNNGLISVNMGIPNFYWQKIPLSCEADSQKISLFDFEFACTNVGNPHAVTFIANSLSDEKFFDVGPKVETNSIFPKKTNVEFAQIISDNLIEVRVWERGAGETLACGSGACAVAILAIRKGLVKNNKVTIRFKGGDLHIEWNGDGSAVIMTGGYEKIFDGVIDEGFFG
jgi:diaminopimelate epimerase